jgi:2-amino-4-ketopentanoate thiolase alpha subunit
MINKGTWIEIEKIVLTSKERAQNIPEETKITPFKCWIRGICLSDCELGDEVEVETNVGRIVKGIAVDVEPGYYHTYGEYVKEMGNVGKQAREMIGQ